LNLKGALRMRALSKSAAAGLTAAALVGAGVSAAFADGIVLDGDSITSAGGGTLDLGTVACSATVTSDVLVAAVRKGNGTKADPVFENGASVAVSVSSVSGSGLGASMGTDSTIGLESTWTAFANNYVSSDTATSSVTLSTSTTAGAGSGTVTFLATGKATDGETIRRSESLRVAWTTSECPTNTAPAAPGAPVASANPTQGGFSLSWAPASDAEDDEVTYTLEGKDADDAGFSPVAAGLTSPAYIFDPGTPEQGTWTYRVRAVESTTTPALQSAWSGDSQPVVVDRTAPNAPTASADRDPDYSGSGSWWKDSVTVTFTDKGDPALPDTSAGSGIASVTGPQTFTTTGTFTAEGTATDNVGLVSSVSTLDVSVDATAPQVSLQCPTTAVVKGSTAYATWTASDLGSGLATAASGQIALETGSVGSRSVSAPQGTAVDNVGHASAATGPCTYSVVYDFRGFFQPVDNIGWNVAKAGSAIPIKFSLGGFQGLDIVAAGYPTFTITGTSQNGDDIEQTVTAGGSSLSYDADTDQYVYVWKTDKAWAGKSGTFTLKLDDGTSHTAKFSFRK
jgi:hypothetical protein